MANIKDFIKKIGNESVSLEEQQQALAQVEKTLVDAKAKREESIGKNVDLVISALKTIESKLEAKLAELNNTPAKQGVQGPTGKDGKDGQNGTDGRDGVSGKDGIDGKDGVDGQDGVSVIDAKIDFDGSLVVFLSNGNEIDCGQILSPDVAQNIIINSGGSGTSQSVTDTLASLQTQINTLTGIDGTLGTMAQQDANAVAITGGTINGTTVGSTTPAAGTFTTITGQTEVLKGTGANLIIYSQDFTNAAWAKTAVTATASGATAPDSTSTAITILETVANSAHNFAPTTALTTSSGALYTISVYVKANGRNYCALYEGISNKGKYFNITAGGGGSVLGNLIAAPVSAALTYIGSDWYRISIVVTAGGTIVPSVYLSTDGTTFSYAGNASLGILAWGMQLEIGSTANTYIPTTTTAVYGTPTLSFSGVSEIGLLSNGALYLQPAGTGAIQAQATTSSTVGGNARGANAVDWQTSRSTAAQVASGSNSFVGSGRNNTSNNQDCFVGAGFQNTASSSQCGIVSGARNQATNTATFIGGGYDNTANLNYGTVVGGQTNTASGFFGFVGNGFTNSTTSSSAVTTQSGTMNATTAVTLSGSNANIKVGQLITGTSIASYTYVAAISGTSLTLSQNASGSSTSTLSFYTPHGVVVGGGNNQATGSYSFIGGGGDAGTAANRNVASGDWSTVGGGFVNRATGKWSTAVGGGGNLSSGEAAVVVGGGSYNGGLSGNTSSGTSAFVGAGFGNTAAGYCSTTVGGAGNNTSNNFSFIGGGSNSNANGGNSAIIGGTYGTTRGISGNHIFPACDIPIASVQGVSQAGLLVLGVQTTDATATVLRSNTSAAGTTNQVILPNNSAYFFRGEVVSGVTGGGNTKGFTIEGVIKRGANAASTALVGTPTVTSTYADAGAATWAIAVTADTTNGGLRITFTGQAATTIRTVCSIRSTEMTF